MMTLDEQRKRVTELDEQIDDLQIQIVDLKKERLELAIEIATAESRFSVGRIVIRNRIVGYTPKTRIITERYRIVGFRGGRLNSKIIVPVAVRIKKDGSTGKPIIIDEWDARQFTLEKKKENV